MSFQLFCGALILLWATRSGGAQNCSPDVNDEIQRCVAPVAKFAEALGVDVNKDTSLGYVPSMGAEVFRQLCHKITAFSSCVRKAKRQCPNHITLTLINASYGYLCTEGYNVFVQNADCLMKLDQEESVRFCHDRTMNAIKNSSGDMKATMPQKLTKMCDSLNYFATCVERPVLRECGLPAWTVIARVLHDTTKTLMPTCKFTVLVPSPSSSAADAVINEKPSVQQSNNGSKSVGRQKVSSVGTMTAASKKDKSNNGGGGRSSSLNGRPSNDAAIALVSWRNTLMSTVGLLWLGYRYRSEKFGT